MASFLKEYSKSMIRKELFYLHIYNLCNLNDLSKDFNIDEIAGTLALYYYAYSKGYLSYNHEFAFNIEKANSLTLPPNDLGLLIATGYGVCRNISYQLKTLLTLKDIKNYVALLTLENFLIVLKS